MEWKIICENCGKGYNNLLLNRCPSCGGILSIKINVRFDEKLIRKEEYSMWRYKEFFPYIEEPVSMGEGWTPLLQVEDGVFLKMDYMNPTGSFKDRGASVLISAIQNEVRGKNIVLAEDSSGNAGAAFSAYVAKAGLRARIYVSKSASKFKVYQIGMYGADIVEVDGDRDKVAEEAMKEEEDKIYLGHRYNPVFRDGFRSIIYEIYEQLDGSMPKTIFVPVSAGTLLLGIIDGLTHLKESGVIDVYPKVVACQVDKISPLYHKFLGKGYVHPRDTRTIADALASVNPPLLDLMVKKLKFIEGSVEVASDSEVKEAYEELARMGIFVEPSSALVWAVYRKTKYEKLAVLVLTGFGLKSIPEI